MGGKGIGRFVLTMFVASVLVSIVDLAYLSTNEIKVHGSSTLSTYVATVSNLRLVWGNDTVQSASVRDNYKDDVDPDVWLTSNNTLMCAFTHKKCDTYNWERWLVKSSDYGEIWSAPVNFSDLIDGMDYQDCNNYGHVMKLSTGEYLLVQKQHRDKNYAQDCLYKNVYYSFQSSDGYSFENKTLICNASALGYEPSTMIHGSQISNGDVLVCWGDKNCNPPYRIHVNRTTDKGATWSQASYHDDDGNGGGYRYFAIDYFPNGTEILVWYQHDEELLRRILSNDNGATWGNSAILEGTADHRSFGFDIVKGHTSPARNNEYYACAREDTGERSMRISIRTHSENGEWVVREAVDDLGWETEPHFWAYNESKAVWVFRAGGTNYNLTGFDFDVYAFDVDLTYSTIIVPDEYSIIQEAINHAADGDTIYIREGTYNEHIVVNKSVSLVGESNVTTIINGADADEPTIWIQRDNVTVTDCKVKNLYPRCRSCIYVDHSNNVHITRNTVRQVCSSTGSYGILLQWSNKSVISHNRIIQQSSWCGGGIRLLGSCHNEFYNNVLAGWGNSTEIDLGCVNNTLTRNVMQNGFRGVCLHHESAHSNVISGNLIETMLFGLSTWMTSNNIICHNSFVNNIVHVEVKPPANNSWNKSYPSGGNYWSDYSDEDVFNGPNQNVTGGDGVWDHPNIINGENVDHYPLVNSWVGASLEETHLCRGGAAYLVQACSNATSWEVKETPGSIRLNVTGETGTSVYVRITLPIRLNASHIKVFLNDTRLTFPSTDPPCSVSRNGTHYVIYCAFTLNSTYALTITFPIEGDINCDGDVDIFDIIRMAGAYGLSLPDPLCDQYCDLDDDRDIDIYDIVLATGNYGESW